MARVTSASGDLPPPNNALQLSAPWATLPGTAAERWADECLRGARVMKERDVALVCERAAEAAYTTQSDQATFERWLGDVTRIELHLSVQVALASLQHSFSLLSHAPWIAQGTAPLLSPCFAWLEEPCKPRALECAQAANGWDRLADTAEARSTDVGDWWTFGAVEHAAMIPAAIGVEAGFALEPESWPRGAPDTAPSYLTEVLIRFSWFPANVDRPHHNTMKAIADALRLVERDGIRAWDPFRQHLAGVVRE